MCKIFIMSTFKTSENGIDRIIGHEGEVLKVYLDAVGKPTVGVGHLLTAAERKKWPVGTRITAETSRELFRSDLKKHENAVNAALKGVKFNQNQFDAMVSLSFNIGETGFKNSSVVRRLRAGDVNGAADAFLLWNKGTVNGKKVVIKGLSNRRKAERALFLTPYVLPKKELAAKQADETVNEKDEKTPNIPPDLPKTSPDAEPPISDPTGGAAVMQAPPPYRGVGFWASIKKDLLAAFGGNFSFGSLSEYAERASGWPEWVVGIIKIAAVGLLIATLGYFVFRVIHYAVDRLQWWYGKKIEAEALSDPAKMSVAFVAHNEGE